MAKKCKHICATLLSINEEVDESRTSKPQEWGKLKSQSDMYRGKTIEELLQLEPSARSISEVDVEKILSDNSDLECSFMKMFY